jgi:GDP-4-dehydro-6-deoxy-D-mannose reductase
MRILVTGISGFAGRHLAEALLAQPGIELFGTSRNRSSSPSQPFADRVQFDSCDLADAMQVQALVRAVKPQQVYHLAGFAHASRSFQEPDAAWDGNLRATRNLYDALHDWGGRPRILYVSSSLVYGEPESPDQAHHERTPLRPASPYASSKAAADLMSYQYTRFPGLDIVRVRPFNHTGPGQSPDYAVPHFAQQVAAIEQGRQAPVLKTGHLSPRRDLTDVRDIIRAYVLLMENGLSGEVYNAGTGVAYSMQEVLDRLLALARVKIEVQEQPELVRAMETNVLRADATRLRQQTGWSPRFSLDQTLRDTLAYWRGETGPCASQ